MQAKEASFCFMQSSICLKIPFFQRGYVWDISNWSELIENLTDNNSSHYLGSIVLKSLGSLSGDVPEWSVVDGQQRLTTLSILFKACCDKLIGEIDAKMTVVKNAVPLNIQAVLDADRQKQVYVSRMNDVLFYKEKPSSIELYNKIRHSHIDAPFYNQVIVGDALKNIDTIVMPDQSKKEKIPESPKILQCYKFFYDYLNSHQDAAKDLFNLLLNEHCYLLVKIDLDNSENEQAIFDTVNSAGVRLTSADTIKNAIYQKALDDKNVSESKVISLYNTTWKETFIKDKEAVIYWGAQRRIGRLFRDNLEVLLHCYALVKGFYEPDRHIVEMLPDLYKKYIEAFDYNQIKDFTEEICEYANIFKKFFVVADHITLYSYSNNLQRLFHILDICDITTFHSYILKLLKDFDVKDPNNLPQGFKDEILKLETLVLRRVLCGSSTKNFNKISHALIMGTTDLSTEFNNINAPADDKLVESKLYAIPNNKIATLIIFWIELYRRNKPLYSVQELKYSYSLEHIMPQKWAENWGLNVCKVVDTNNNELIDTPENLSTIRQKAIWEIGNMMLLKSSLNSSLRNFEFGRKVDGEGKKKGIRAYADSLVTTSEVIDVYDTTAIWNEYEIRKRTLDFINDFMSLWPSY